MCRGCQNYLFASSVFIVAIPENGAKHFSLLFSSSFHAYVFLGHTPVCSRVHVPKVSVGLSGFEAENLKHKKVIFRIKENLEEKQ